MSFSSARQFTWVCLAAISFVGLTLLFGEWRQNQIFRGVQADQLAAIERIQAEFVRRAQEGATRDLIAVQEAAHSDVSRVFANRLWHGDIEPLVGESQRVARKSCPARDTGCAAQLGRRLRQLPEFARLDLQVRQLMRHTGVVKLKVYDPNGLTVYSSDPQQLGENQSDNPGFRAALGGSTSSELEFRDTFNTFEGVAEKIDVIGSYIPVRIASSGTVVAVMETYTDVTPFVRRIEDKTAEYNKEAAGNREEIDELGRQGRERVLRTGLLQAAIVTLLLTALFVVLVSTVRRAQRTAERQARERDAAKRQLAQAEKMTALGQMVAGVAHQLNTPLAFSRSNVAMIRSALARMHPLPPALISAPEMLEDVFAGMDQMDELVGKLRDFTRLDRERTGAVDIREALASVAYIARAVVSTKIRIIEAYEEVPAISCNVSQLNQAFLNIVMNAAQAMHGGGVIMICATRRDACIEVTIRDTGPGIAQDVLPHIFEPHFTTKPAGEGTGLGLSIALESVVEHGGSITVDTREGSGTAFFIQLPLTVERVTELTA